jgi:hypothetical protein
MKVNIFSTNPSGYTYEFYKNNKSVGGGKFKEQKTTEE